MFFFSPLFLLFLLSLSPPTARAGMPFDRAFRATFTCVEVAYLGRSDRKCSSRWFCERLSCCSGFIWRLKLMICRASEFHLRTLVGADAAAVEVEEKVEEEQEEEEEVVVGLLHVSLHGLTLPGRLLA